MVEITQRSVRRASHACLPATRGGEPLDDARAFLPRGQALQLRIGSCWGLRSCLGHDTHRPCPCCKHNSLLLFSLFSFSLAGLFAHWQGGDETITELTSLRKLYTSWRRHDPNIRCVLKACPNTVTTGGNFPGHMQYLTEWRNSLDW